LASSSLAFDNNHWTVNLFPAQILVGARFLFFFPVEETSAHANQRNQSLDF